MYKSFRVLSCLFILFSLIMMGGVYAIWKYAAYADPQSENLTVGLMEFSWAPEEVLPDDEEDTDQDINHMAIMDEILFNSKMGLNMKVGAINNAVEAAGELHYVESISGGNLKHLIDVSEGGKNIGFAFKHIDDNSFYCYSFYRIDHPAGVTITVYRTLYAVNTDPTLDVNEDGRVDKWCMVSSQRGTAETIKGLKHMESYECSIDPETWQPSLATDELAQ